MRNIHIRDVHYGMDCKTNETSRDGGSIFKFDKLCAVYFNMADCKLLTVNGVTAGQSLAAVFGGSGDVSLRAENIIKLGPDTELVDGEDIEILGSK